MTTANSPFRTLTVRRPSLSDLVDFEDLNLLEGSDLRAVFNQVEEPLVLDALVGSTVNLRQRLLTNLPRVAGQRLEEQLVTHRVVTFEMAYAAQRVLVETMCRLSRAGMVAFDDPADMVA